MFWAVSKPKTFLRKKPFKIRKNQTWEFNRFSDHETSRAHAYAVKCKERQAGQQKLSFFKKSSSEKSEDPLHNLPDEYIATVMMLLVEKVSTAKICRILKFNKLVEKNAAFPVSHSFVDLILESFSTVVKSMSDSALEKSFVVGLLVDDGSAADTREWQSVCVRGDSFQDPGADQAFLCLYSLSKLNFDQLNAEGMLAVVLENFSDKILKRVVWLTKDGASVMGKFARLFAERCNPFAFSLWCANHRGNLSLKDSVYESQNMALLLDFMKLTAKYFQFSNKSSDILRSKLPAGISANSLKRVENLTRWTGIFTSLRAMLALYQFVVHCWSDEFFAAETPSSRKRKIKSLCNQAFDYRMIIRMFVLRDFSACYTKFHDKLQDRKNDFTTTSQALTTLKLSVSKICRPENFANISVEVMKIVKALKELPRSQELQKAADVDARLSDFEEKWVVEVTKSESENLLEVFEESVAQRFDEEELGTVNAFAIFDPNTFPNTVSMDEMQKQSFYTDHGLSSLSKLKAWYGVKKGNFEPIIDSEKINSQWEEFKIWFANQQKLGVQFGSFRLFYNAVSRQAKLNARFATDFSEIIKLLRIAEAKPDSSAECERSFSSLKGLLTSDRTSLSDDSVSALVRVSFETKRHAPEEHQKILDLLPQVKQVLSKKLSESRRLKAEKERGRQKQQASASKS